MRTKAALLGRHCVRGVLIGRCEDKGSSVVREALRARVLLG